VNDFGEHAVKRQWMAEPWFWWQRSAPSAYMHAHHMRKTSKTVAAVPRPVFAKAGACQGLHFRSGKAEFQSQADLPL
jgi:hypothetical protein